MYKCCSDIFVLVLFNLNFFLESGLFWWMSDIAPFLNCVDSSDAFVHFFEGGSVPFGHYLLESFPQLLLYFFGIENGNGRDPLSRSPGGHLGQVKWTSTLLGLQICRHILCQISAWRIRTLVRHSHGGGTETGQCGGGRRLWVEVLFSLWEVEEFISPLNHITREPHRWIEGNTGLDLWFLICVEIRSIELLLVSGELDWLLLFLIFDCHLVDIWVVACWIYSHELGCFVSVIDGSSVIFLLV